VTEPVGLRERLEQLANRGEDRGPQWLIDSVNRSLTEPTPPVDPARRPIRRPLITVAFAFAAVAVVVLAVIVFGPRSSHSSPSPATTPTPTPTTRTSALPVSVFDDRPAFFSVNEGWLCQVPLEYTGDRGVTWKRIVVGLKGFSENEERCVFAPGGRAWVGMPGQPPDLIPHVVRVVAGPHPTVDSVPLPGASSETSIMALSFSDPLHGWALTATGHDPNPAVAGLYATTDGGAHWRKIARNVPAMAVVRFSSPTTGWGFTVDQLEHTVDGGRTWRVVAMAPTPVVRRGVSRELSSVTVVGERVMVAGIVPTGTNVEHFFVEVSNDAGAHWSLVQVSPTDVGPPFALPWQFVAVDADHWRYVDRRSYASSDDAGKTWHVEANHIPIANTAAISFVTPDIAWTAQCSNGLCNSALTTDNGKIWGSARR
jgi:hypothetical protein